MSHVDRQCVFGCESERDTQAHYLSCPLLWGAILQVWFPDRPMPYFLDHRLALARSLTDDECDLACQRLIIAFYMYNIRSHALSAPLDLPMCARAARSQLLQQAKMCD